MTYGFAIFEPAPASVEGGDNSCDDIGAMVKEEAFAWRSAMDYLWASAHYVANDEPFILARYS